MEFQLIRGQRLIVGQLYHVCWLLILFEITSNYFTGAGELEVFSTIEDNLSEALPQDTCDWRRSLGRPVRPVRIGATFTPYNSAALPKGNQWDLIRQPLFHIYWTDCSVSN